MNSISYSVTGAENINSSYAKELMDTVDEFCLQTTVKDKKNGEGIDTNPNS
jgi:hypothetical protein